MKIYCNEKPDYLWISNFATGLVFGEKQNKKHSLKHVAYFISSKHQIIVVVVSL